MFHCYTVQGLAFERNFHELVCSIEEYPKEYFELILHGRNNMMEVEK